MKPKQRKRGTRRIFARLLAVLMALSVVNASGWNHVVAKAADDVNISYAPAAAVKYDIDGDGKEEEVYEISNADQLYWFAGLVNGTLTDVEKNASANAVLTADIVVNENVLTSDGTLNDRSFKEWTPIGTFDIPYTGIFEGQRHTISGLYVNQEGKEYVGLFGSNSGMISNVGILDSYFSGRYYVGGVSGDNYEGTVTNCYNTGSVNGEESVGGVIAYNYGTITNCYNIGSVSGQIFVGGVIGDNYEGTITNCYNTGSVSGQKFVGGLIASDKEGTITNCYYDNTIYAGDAIGDNHEAGTIDKVEGKTTEQFKTGEVAYLLQFGQSEDVWGQTIGTDTHPTLGGAKVYQNAVYSGCEGNPGEPESYEYSNTEKNTYGEHQDADNDGICDNCDAIIDGIGARLAGHSLTLDGSVGVSFYMELSDEVLADENTYMRFTLPSGADSKVLLNKNNCEVISGKTYYKFKCQVNAHQMTDTITAQLISSVGSSQVYEYTVKEYADYLFANKDNNTEFGEAYNLVKAMVDYGSYAQIYADYNTDNLAVGDKSNLTSVDGVVVDKKYNYTSNGHTNPNVTFAGASLTLLSTTTLKLYFKLTDVEADKVTFTYSGQELDKIQSGDYYYVNIVGIPADKLNDDCTVTVAISGEDSKTTSFDVTYNPMAYCYNVLTRETTETRTETLKNLIRAMVLYNKAADDYVTLKSST